MRALILNCNPQAFAGGRRDPGAAEAALRHQPPHGAVEPSDDPPPAPRLLKRPVVVCTARLQTGNAVRTSFRLTGDGSYEPERRRSDEATFEPVESPTLPPLRRLGRVRRLLETRDWRALEDAYEQLPETERHSLDLRYGLRPGDPVRCTQLDAATALGLDRVDVQRLEARAIGKLAALSRDR